MLQDVFGIRSFARVFPQHAFDKRLESVRGVGGKGVRVGGEGRGISMCDPREDLHRIEVSKRRNSLVELQGGYSEGPHVRLQFIIATNNTGAA